MIEIGHKPPNRTQIAQGLLIQILHYIRSDSIHHNLKSFMQQWEHSSVVFCETQYFTFHLLVLYLFVSIRIRYAKKVRVGFVKQSFIFQNFSEFIPLIDLEVFTGLGITKWILQKYFLQVNWYYTYFIWSMILEPNSFWNRKWHFYSYNFIYKSHFRF